MCGDRGGTEGEYVGNEETKQTKLGWRGIQQISS